MSNIRPTGGGPASMNYQGPSPSQPVSVSENLPSSANQVGRNLSLADLIAPGSPNTYVTAPPVRTPSPGASRMAASLHEAYEEAQPDPSRQTVPADKGKGRAATPPGTPSRSPSPVIGKRQSRSLPASPNSDIPDKKRINTGAPAVLAQGTSTHGAATGSQPHYYEQIRPRPEIAPLVASGKALTHILKTRDIFLDNGQSALVINFSDFIRAQKMKRADVLKNFHSFNFWMHHYYGQKQPTPPTLAILRKLRSVVFSLPSQEKWEQIRDRNGPAVAQMSDYRKKTFEDAAGRLDEMFAGSPLSGSVYEGPDAQQRFIELKHEISRKTVTTEATRDFALFELLSILRSEVHPLPLDGVLLEAATNAVNNYAESRRKLDGSATIRKAILISEIAHLENFSNDDVLHVLKQWKAVGNFKTMEAGASSENAHDLTNISDQHIHIFDTISKSLAQIEVHKGRMDNVKAISEALKTADEQTNQAPGNVSGSSQIS